MTAFPPPQVPNPARMDPSEMRRQLTEDPTRGWGVGAGETTARSTRRTGALVAVIGILAAVLIRVLG